jgi:hypothetical protein
MKIEITWKLESRIFNEWRTVSGDTKLKDVLVHFMDSAWKSVKDKHIERVYGDRVVFFDEKGTKLILDKTIQQAFPNAKSGKSLKLIAAYDLRKSERTPKRKRED